MSKYTTELRFICEMLAGKDENPDMTVDDVIEQSKLKIFDFVCNSHDAIKPWEIEYVSSTGEKCVHDLSELFSKIILHYYTREICEETYGLWKLRLKSRMAEIMPYYLQLYDSLKIKYNIFNDVDYSITSDTVTDMLNNGTVDDTGNSSSSEAKHQSNNTSSTDYNLYSDTPQGALTHVDEENYLTNATKDIYNGNNTYDQTTNKTSEFTENTVSSSTSNKNENKIQHIAGKRGFQSRQKLINEYRKSIINVDKQIIDELSDLFFGLY